MDPISLMLLSGVLLGVAGNRADAALRLLYQRLMRGDPPVRTLAAAIRRAYLQATLSLFSAYLKELGQPSGFIQGKAHNLQRLFGTTGESGNIRWAKATNELLKEELKQLTPSAYSVRPRNLDNLFQTVLESLQVSEEKRQQSLVTELKKELLRELQSISSGTSETPLGLLEQREIPSRFVDMLTNGWHESSGSYGATVYIEWFQLFCTFFNHILNTNGALRDLLADEVMPRGFQSVTFPAFQQQLVTFGQDLGAAIGAGFAEVHKQLEMVNADYRQQFGDIKTRLDQLLPYIALLPEIWSEQNITNVVQLVAKELSSPEHKRYRGAEIANREAKLISDLPPVFIGRDDHVKQLNSFVANNVAGMLLLTAEAGFGKTSLLLNWMNELRDENCFVAYHFFSTKYDVTRSIDLALTNLLQQLYEHWQIYEAQLPTEEQSLRDAIVGLLREKLGHKGNERVVIIIDGLDEADGIFSPPVPLPLPKGLFVIGSARASEGESPLYLMYWVEQSARMSLSPLSMRDIVRWLQRAGGGELIEFAKNQYSVQKIYERTAGFPLFLHYLIPQLVEAIRSTGDISYILDQTPTSFGQYVATQFNLLTQSPDLRKATEIQKLFSILTVAKGPIDEEDLSRLSNLSHWELRSLPWQVSRWVSVQQREGSKSYTFAHKLLAESFSAILQSNADKARSDLTEYCSRWSEHKSTYALKHYAEHLWDLGSWHELTALACDTKFSQLQRASFPYLSNLQLTTTQLGLKSAIQLNDMRSAASLMLNYLKLAEDTTPQQDPLEIFDSGDLATAWATADNYDGKAPTLWRLLLILRLMKQGRVDKAEELLRSLISHPSIRMSKLWEGELCKNLIIYLDELDEDLRFEAALKLLKLYFIRTLIISLSRRDRKSLSLAHRLTKRIFGPNRDKAVVEVSKSYARANEWNTALESINVIDDPFVIAWALSDLTQIALTQHDVPQAELLLTRLRELEDSKGVGPRYKHRQWRVEISWQTARALAAIGEHLHPFELSKSSEYFSQAEQSLNRIQQGSIKGRAMVDLARIYSSVGRRDEANSLLDAAQQIAKNLRFPREKARLLTYIGRCYEAMDRTDLFLDLIAEAVALVDEITEPEPRIEVLAECAIDYVYAGESSRAVDLALRIRVMERIAETFQTIARLLLERGELDLVTELAQRFQRYNLTRIGILVELGLHRLASDSLDEAERIFSHVLRGVRLSTRRGQKTHANSCFACLAKAHFVAGNSLRGNALVATLMERINQEYGLPRFWSIINTVNTVGEELDRENLRDLLQSAYEAVQVIENSSRRVWLFSVLGRCLFQQGFNEWSEELFGEAELMIAGISNLSEKREALCKLSEAVAATNQVDRAGELLNAARDIADGMSLFAARAGETSKVALAFAKVGRLDDAEALANSAGSFSKKEARRAKSIVYAHHDKALAALTEAERIINPRERAQAIRDIALIQISKNNPVVAVQLAERLTATEDGRSQLFRILRELRERQHRESFFDLIPFCIHNYGAVFEVIGQLALHTPTQAVQLEEIFRETLQSTAPGMNS